MPSFDTCQPVHVMGWWREWLHEAEEDAPNYDKDVSETDARSASHAQYTNEVAFGHTRLAALGFLLAALLGWVTFDAATSPESTRKAVVPGELEAPNSTATCSDFGSPRFGACCNEYGFTPMPIWVLYLQSIVSALVFDMPQYCATGYAAPPRMDQALTVAFLGFQIVSGTAALWFQYIVFPYKSDPSEVWTNYNELIWLAANSGFGFSFANFVTVILRVPPDSHGGSVGVGGGAVVLGALGTYTAMFWRRGLWQKAAVVVAVLSVCAPWTAICLAQIITHGAPAVVVFFPLALTLIVGGLCGVLLHKPPLRPSWGHRHSSRLRLLYGPIRAVLAGTVYLTTVLLFVILISMVAILYSGKRWAEAISQDYRSRSTHLYIECRTRQLDGDFHVIATITDTVWLAVAIGVLVLLFALGGAAAAFQTKAQQPRPADRLKPQTHSHLTENLLSDLD
jgi:hypothetical protein